MALIENIRRTLLDFCGSPVKILAIKRGGRKFMLLNR